MVSELATQRAQLLIECLADAPDLGAFTTVFRELNNAYQHPRGNGNGRHLTDSGESARTPTSTFLLSDYDSEAPVGSTVWAQGPIADYLEQTDSEGQEQTSAEEDGEQPSLSLSGVFNFLAEERTRLARLREATNGAGRAVAGHSSSTTSDGTWRHIVPTRRRRRKRRADRSQSVHNQIRLPTNLDATVEEAAENDEEEDDDDEEDESTSDSAPANYYESTPVSPLPNGHRRQRSNISTTEDREGRPLVHHSRSTPSLRLQTTAPINPRILQLRNLAHKLRMLYPKDARFLSAILSKDQPDDSDIVDPRGPMPRAKDTPFHVFIDQ